MSAKKFFYVSAGIVLLVIAYSIGASRLSAQQAGGQFTGIAFCLTGTTGTTMAITANGDVYARNGFPYCTGATMVWYSPSCAWTYMGSVPGRTVPATGTSWNKVKGAFRK